MKNGVQIILAAALMALCSCSVWNELQTPYKGREYRNEDVMSQAPHGKKRIVIYLDTQTGEFLVDGRKGMIFPVSTGIPGHSTPAGHYSIYSKDRNNRSSIYGTIYNSKGEVVVAAANAKKDRVPPGGYYLGADMPFTMRFTGPCAFHEGIVPEEPTLTSHGCIHLTGDVAEELYRLCPVGTRVSIYKETPSIAQN